MFKLAMYDEAQVKEVFSGYPQSMEVCDNCGADLEQHKRLVVEFDLTGEDRDARHWLAPREPSAQQCATDPVVVNNYRVVGCDRKARTWRLWAIRNASPVSGREFTHFGDERTLRTFYGRSGEPTLVELTEDPQGGYYGWIDCDPKTGHAGTPFMVQPHEGVFRMQEPGGFRQRVEQGFGEVVRMSATAVA